MEIAIREISTGRIKRKSVGDSGPRIVYDELNGQVPEGMELIGVDCPFAGVRAVGAIPPVGQKLDPPEH